MALSKAAKRAIEEAPVLTTGQPMALRPQSRAERANLPMRGSKITVQAKVPGEEPTHYRYVGTRRNDIEKAIFDVVVVDGEVLLIRSYSLWATATQSSGPMFNSRRQEALHEKLVEVAKEAQAYSDSLGRNPPDEDEIHNTLVRRDIRRVSTTKTQAGAAKRKLDGFTHVEMQPIEQAFADLATVLKDEEKRLKGLLRKGGE